MLTAIIGALLCGGLLAPLLKLIWNRYEHLRETFSCAAFFFATAVPLVQGMLETGLEAEWLMEGAVLGASYSLAQCEETDGFSDLSRPPELSSIVPVLWFIHTLIGQAVGETIFL